MIEISGAAGVDLILDLTLEQDYVRRRLRRHNRELHGVGIVRRLEVAVRSDGSGCGQHLAVEPGFALAPGGEEIEVQRSARISLPRNGSVLHVLLLRAERPTCPRPTADGVQFARTEEGFALSAEGAAADSAVLLARLLRADGGWYIDPAFVPARAKTPWQE